VMRAAVEPGRSAGGKGAWMNLGKESFDLSRCGLDSPL